MIAALLIAGHVAAAPAMRSPAPSPPPPTARELLDGAEHAVETDRLDQANLMIARAMSAGASGIPLALVLADLAFAKGKYDEALVRYEGLAARFPSDARLLERAGLSALEIGNAGLASPNLLRATALPEASWRAWNARGVAADLKHDWTDAATSYDRASKLAPDAAAPVSNRGWSFLLQGDWTEAVACFERAAGLDPKSERIGDNLELARAALAVDLPRRRPGEADRDWAARLNDAGVAASLLGDKRRAAAAFIQALDASGSWYRRAANNLEAVSSP